MLSSGIKALLKLRETACLFCWSSCGQSFGDYVSTVFFPCISSPSTCPTGSCRGLMPPLDWLFSICFVFFYNCTPPLPLHKHPWNHCTSTLNWLCFSFLAFFNVRTDLALSCSLSIFPCCPLNFDPFVSADHFVFIPLQMPNIVFSPFACAHFFFLALTSPCKCFGVVCNRLNWIMLYVPVHPAKYCQDALLATCEVKKQ